jgi:hypothetical protein
MEEFHIGPRLPVIKRATLREMDSHGRLVVDADLTYAGGFHTSLLVVVAIKKPLAVLASPLRRFSRKSTDGPAQEDCFLIPVRVSAHVNSVAGTFRFLANAPPAESFWIGFAEDPEADIDVTYEVGAGRQVTHRHLPKIAQLAELGLRRAIRELFVHPNMDDVPFPKVGQKEKVDAYLRRREQEARDAAQDSPGASKGTGGDDNGLADVAAADPDDVDAALKDAFEGSGSSLSSGAIEASIDSLMARHIRRTDSKEKKDA